MSGSVLQSGAVTQGHLAIWGGNGTVMDGGSPVRITGGVANILDYGGGIGGDDALAMRNAIASGNQIIFVPPGTYTNRSVVTGPAHAAGNTAWLMDGLTNTYIFAYGSTWLMSDDAPGGDHGTSFLQIAANCKNVGMFGGTLVGNKTGLSPSRENCAFLIAGVTGLTLRDITITGTFLTFFAGVFAFDSLIENIHVYNVALAVDISSMENTTFNKCFFWATTDSANNAAAALGVNCHYDVLTLADGTDITYEDGSPRTLYRNNTNGLKFKDCVFNGFFSGIFIDSCWNALISKCVFNGATRAPGRFNASAVILAQGTNAIAAGYITTDVVIEDCEISNYAVLAGGAGQGYGIDISPGTAGGIISLVTIVNCRIYDNTHTGIGSSNYNPGSVTTVTVQTCDFATRTNQSIQTVNVISQILALGPPLGPYAPSDDPTFTNGIHFGSVVDSSNTSVAQHLDLFGGTNGIGITAGRVNYITGGSQSHCFMVGSTQEATINSLGFNATTLKVIGNLGFYNTTPIAKQTVGGAWAGNTAGKALSTALAALGLITDTSTP